MAEIPRHGQRYYRRISGQQKGFEGRKERRERGISEKKNRNCAKSLYRYKGGQIENWDRIFSNEETHMSIPDCCGYLPTISEA